MSAINKQIISVSTNLLYKYAKIDGYLNLDKINNLYLYDYYLDFTKNKPNYNNEHSILRNEIYRMRKRLDNICNYKSILSNNLISNSINQNTPPFIINPISIDITNDQTYRMDMSQIYPNNYGDNENDGISLIQIYISDVSQGTFKLNNNIVTTNISLTPSQFNNLVYYPDNGSYTVNIPFRMLDNNLTPLYSQKYNYTINVEEVQAINQPPTIGDITIYADNRTVTVITLDMLTNQLTPPYNDPEGDLLDAIRIDEISTANKGVYLYNGSPITEGLIIPATDIINNLFTHEAANQNAISSDVFEFSVRDSANRTWVN